jgi:hypothetical protein
MDEVGLRELIGSGVKAAKEGWLKARKTGAPYPALDDSELSTILDRFVQIGVVALEHSASWLWSEMIDGLLDIYRIGLPADHDTWKPPASETRFLVDVTQRVMTLGATVIRLKKYEYLRTLALQAPVERWKDNHWIRYTVTLASRGELKEAFRGKSLIGPVAEYIRSSPELGEMFEQNQDVVVNALCQSDFLNCVIVVAETKDVDSCYPNFGGYYEHRTLPIVHDLIRGGAPRNALPNVPDDLLAEVLDAIDKETRHAFFDISGWHGYDQQVTEFIKAHLPKS